MEPTNKIEEYLMNYYGYLPKRYVELKEQEAFEPEVWLHAPNNARKRIHKRVLDWLVENNIRALFWNYDHFTFWKEVVEAYIVAKKFSGKVKKDGVLYDIGTGHGLLLPFYNILRGKHLKLYGVDLQERHTWGFFQGMYDNITFIKDDVRNVVNLIDSGELPKPNTIIGIHNCRELSAYDVEFATKYNANLILMPCCSAPKYIEEKTGFSFSSFGNLFKYLNSQDQEYGLWVTSLAFYIHLSSGGSYNISIRQPKLLKAYTPKNIIIYARPKQY